MTPSPLMMILLSSLAVACGASDGPTDSGYPEDTRSADGQVSTDDSSPRVDGAVPTVLGIANISPYQVVRGIVTIEITTGPIAPDAVTLIVKGQEVARAESAPFSLRWDTTQHEDALIWLRLETADEQSESLTVMVLNEGQRISFDSAPTQTGGVGETVEGSFLVLEDGSFEPLGSEAQWELPPGFRAIVMLLFWNNEAFEMQFEVGRGTDHASGSFAVGGRSNYSPTNIWYSLTHERTDLAPGVCYVYVSPQETDDPALQGQNTGFRLEGFLLR
ncbi:MAG: hypothetical protein JRH20_16430 [Deltaproteobacteria bacterium]|nr:hypothetical protein [Deltaproteobacteria bacterium]